MTAPQTEMEFAKWWLAVGEWQPTVSKAILKDCFLTGQSAGLEQAAQFIESQTLLLHADVREMLATQLRQQPQARG